jgi:hypothetical protein
MVSIEVLHRTLSRRIARVQRYLNEDASKYKFDASMHKSAAISHLWQSWVIHNRTLLTAYISGNLIVAGGVLSSPIHGLSEDERLYCAQQWAEGNQPKAGVKIKNHLGEPNWGDISKAVSICAGASFECSRHVASCFALGVRIRDLQLCRNTCAHMSRGQLREFNSSRVRYGSNSYLHPSDMMGWIDPLTKQPLWNSWVGEMLTITELIGSSK